MIANVLLILCGVILIAYLIDVFSAKIKVPSVVLLLSFGFIIKYGLQLLNIAISDVSRILPLVGTVGLVLIVLEGSLELKIDATKIPLIKKAFWVSWLAILVLVITTVSWCYFVFDYPLIDSIVNLMPLCIISSAIAIPSAKAFNEVNKEFVVYESSFSDIIGVVLFNFFATTEIINLAAGIKFTSDIILILIITCVSTIASAVLLYKVNTHVKHVPLLALILLVYAITKILHLPGLIYILILGLVFSNASFFNNFKIFKKVRFENFNAEVIAFTDLVIEATFLMRILFFTLFGFSLNINDLLSTAELPYAIAFVLLIFLSRAVLLKFFKVPLIPVLFVAPRGLITILLFLSVPLTSQLPLINKTLLIQMVLLTASVLILGGVLNKKSNI